MDAAGYERVMALFDAACDMARPEQQKLLAELQASEPALGARLAKMLAHDAAGTEVMAPGAAARALAREVDDGAQAVAAGARRRREGQRVDGYEVGAWLGQGSMGSVHRGRDLSSGETVAIKFLKGSAGDSGSRRLQREFETLSRLDHPGCVRVFAHGRSAHGRYLVMDYVAGGDLRARVGRRSADELRILAQVAEALAYIHSHGVVHRDLKPENVLLTAQEVARPRLVDFGIAKTADATTLLTGSDELLGSLDFLAPEQCRGRDADARSDLYALGCLLHVLWVGKAPFGGDSIDRLSARMNRRPPRLDALLPGVPAPLATLAQALMSPSPDDRPANARAVAAQLHRLGHEALREGATPKDEEAAS